MEPVDPKMDNLLNASVTIPNLFDISDRVAQGGVRGALFTLSFEGRLFDFPRSAGGRLTSRRVNQNPIVPDGGYRQYQRIDTV
jgi:hypothetical protein